MQHRKSHQRERILQVLQGTVSHPTADWVYRELKDEMPALSLGTVYRNLKFLADQGRIQKLPLGSTFDRYDADTNPHYHVVCENCGSVEDLELPVHSELDKKANKMSGFKVSHHRIDFFGLCTECQKQEQALTKKKER